MELLKLLKIVSGSSSSSANLTSTFGTYLSFSRYYSYGVSMKYNAQTACEVLFYGSGRYTVNNLVGVLKHYSC
jgi:hypothetical protein